MSSPTTLIESTFLNTQKPLLQWLNRRLGCAHTAEDLTQETYLRVIQQGTLDTIGDLRAYLFRIASNLVIDHWRQPTVQADADCESLEEDLICPKPTPDRIAEASQEFELLRHFIAELPPKCRRIFLMHKVQQLSHVEIAEQLAISPRTVETQIRKALMILRDRMRAP